MEGSLDFPAENFVWPRTEQFNMALNLLPFTSKSRGAEFGES